MSIFVCNNCGWAHFGVAKDFIEKSSEDFMQYYDGLSVEQRKSYGQNSITKSNLISKYMHCFNCGGSYENFHVETAADKIPDGCTIQGILISD